ncbi:hypothetical protein QBC44DRAFT_379754 [Cladorrhinum sp. PSN332]|nr:hypothetical protein QBC44DRAFT_379754 [Cladorrhinum sp. PSN332]
MSSELDRSFHEELEVDQNVFFDFDAYYRGEGSHLDNHTYSTPNNDRVGLTGAVTQHDDVVPELGAILLGQPEGAHLFLGAASLHRNMQEEPVGSEQPISLPHSRGTKCPPCNIIGCTYRQPFNRAADLDRHMQAMHGAVYFPCPHDTCSKHAHNFKRKDKLQQHMREKHADLLANCHHAHCTSQISDLQHLTHMQEDHGMYECALEPCSVAGESYFTKQKLNKHLRDHHKMSRGVCDRVMTAILEAGETTARREHVPSSTRMKKEEPCSVCQPVVQQAQVPDSDVMCFDGAEAGQYSMY